MACELCQSGINLLLYYPLIHVTDYQTFARERKWYVTLQLLNVLTFLAFGCFSGRRQCLAQVNVSLTLEPQLFILVLLQLELSNE